MDATQTHRPFEIEITIAPEDIDQLGHVNNVVYLRWVQDAAVAHWLAVATEKERQTLAWVVVKHEIEYKRPAFESDAIIARTWVGGASRGVFERHSELLRRSDRKLLAKALTLWCPVDHETKKPVEVGPDVRRRFSSPQDPPV
jgi:acyl-CoA thioester hydrolase